MAKAFLSEYNLYTRNSLISILSEKEIRLEYIAKGNNKKYQIINRKSKLDIRYVRAKFNNFMISRNIDNSDIIGLSYRNNNITFYDLGDDKYV